MIQKVNLGPGSGTNARMKLKRREIVGDCTEGLIGGGGDQKVSRSSIHIHNQRQTRGGCSAFRLYLEVLNLLNDLGR